MRKNGFTLIELLAVIVILAIIALIAVPIILNIINDSKKEATLRSAQNYLDAVEQAIVAKNMTGEFNPSTCDINSDGNLSCGIGNLTISVDGERPTSGIITFDKGKVDTVSNLKYGTNTVSTDENGKLVLGGSSVDEVKVYQTLVTGSDFNSKIKTLATNASNITSIEFLSNGSLPEGYTKEQLTSLSNADVSANNDGSVMAYYDGNGNMYIYSDDYITGNADSSYMFGQFSSLDTLTLDEFYTDSVTDMSHMFDGCYELTGLDVSNFNTSNVINMSWMFAQCNKVLGLEKFDTSNVTDMSGMFDLAVVDAEAIKNWNTSSVTNMYMLFSESALWAFELVDLSNWDTSNVTNMGSMFDASSVKSLNLSGWDTSKVTNMNYMFNYCESLTCIQVGDKWSTTQATTAGMFDDSGVTATQTTACPVTSS